jgi:hypothetical protein
MGVGNEPSGDGFTNKMEGKHIVSLVQLGMQFS